MDSVIKILKSDNFNHWYSDRIGDIFPVICEYPERYSVDCGASYGNSYFVEKIDCMVVARGDDPTNPGHYRQHGIECIQVTENMGFLQGNIVKYVWRYKDKNGLEDLNKAMWYLKRLIDKEAGSELSVSDTVKDQG